MRPTLDLLPFRYYTIERSLQAIPLTYIHYHRLLVKKDETQIKQSAEALYALLRSVCYCFLERCVMVFFQLIAVGRKILVADPPSRGLLGITNSKRMLTQA